MQGTIPELADSDTIAGLSLFTRTILEATGTLNPKPQYVREFALQGLPYACPRFPTPPSLVFAVAAQTSKPRKAGAYQVLGSIRFRV